MSLKQVFTCEAQLTAFAAKIAMILVSGDVVYLRGELGTGKTTFARAIIQQMGRVDSVTSPTFTLIETYDLNEVLVAHLDLYRIESEAEMEGVGLRDYLDGDWICLIEWPDRAPGMLPDPDLTIDLAYEGKGRSAVLVVTERLADRADWLK
ncbi:MAG TPA: tRNA (adenosine(37)-N6)-threonylcarbamoyltransferase complex ATPase subunit type 1 TsaE [Gammaproteobacteria bacterium]|jgi:tRNA threonylcarbamoyladenosine biosynthesis protein TsaE|nr:tRNA (adenosine(37)-N6)-threonylcarbamoyltransferase complex ATPase subunit type 1 TsaE [Gammaproteobacteria bacterium]PHS09636.1 MAG: tRNA (adenosine(37)-N6)-threonylcarbamoyltransferase complex ATPase subunit type 1 TsaE [Acidithiobacillus sp.]RTZ64029.1 MAG: tRNA (adenosine(37)-N6)-threonylcarbamoyltransferase complex ATPase subunit type 1 TsaE [Gammaproteobacteria bacterium]HAD36319.1 tRNA (adenosine(37)-N6)-threonylcarbamoyltransferase complex ATPase subunit type 1 TsaE [Gammaproteobacte|tara:strand:+ start:44 stop:496 length:453 start_codon:yes stop_codon:yes gene_type:complete